MLYSQKISYHSRSKKDAVSYLNVIVVGAAGSGKTCFIRTLYEALRQDMIQGTFKESKHKSLKGCVEPTEEMYTISMHIEDGGRRTALTLTDTPGFTSNSQLVEQLKSITQHIDSQFARTLAEVLRINSPKPFSNFSFSNLGIKSEARCKGFRYTYSCLHLFYERIQYPWFVRSG
jgi:cell division control protein 11